MNHETKLAGDVLLELEELKKVDVKPEEEGTYSITYNYGTFFTLLCC